jgi:hypothetical protein
VERPTVTLAANVGEHEQTLRLPDGTHDLLAASEPGATSLAGSDLCLPPMSVAVLAREHASGTLV